MMKYVLLTLPILSLALWALSLFVFPIRTSLILNGRPFAKVVPKSEVDIFNYTKIDSLRCYAIVFSWGKAVGYVERPLGWPAPYYVPLGDPPSVFRENNGALFTLRFYSYWLFLSLLAFPAEIVIVTFSVIRGRMRRFKRTHADGLKPAD